MCKKYYKTSFGSLDPAYEERFNIEQTNEGKELLKQFMEGKE
jgi:hypothetical protein